MSWALGQIPQNMALSQTNMTLLPHQHRKRTLRYVLNFLCFLKPLSSRSLIHISQGILTLFACTFHPCYRLMEIVNFPCINIFFPKADNHFKDSKQTQISLFRHLPAAVTTLNKMWFRCVFSSHFSWSAAAWNPSFFSWKFWQTTLTDYLKHFTILTILIILQNKG